MADAAVEFLLENIQQLLLYRVPLIRDVMDQLGRLERDLCLFKAFLKDSTKKRRKDEMQSVLARQIHDVVYKVEDAVDAFVSQRAAPDSGSEDYFQTHGTLDSVVGDVMRDGSKIRDIYRLKSLVIGDEESEDTEIPIVRQKNIIGFDDEAEKLIGYLSEETEQVDVISIIGMPGLGKTTLAGKIFHDPVIQYEFPMRIWVGISQDFSKKDVFLAIMKEFTVVTDDMRKKTDLELANIISNHLQRYKFLIVMDDVWTPEDWDNLRIALPSSNKMGKVLITSRHEAVGRSANSRRDPHHLRFLTQDESWLLLQLEVFGKPECPPDLEHFGKLIARQCDGLPVAIVLIGGILAKKFSDEDPNPGAVWRKMSHSVGMYLNEDQTGRMQKIIGLSYDKLPFQLRACFLYFGMFPEEYEIPAWKLTWMWIAEGFIPYKEGMKLEETAENYLEELVSRNLVRIGKMKSDGTVKTCRIHGMLRNFCINEAGKEKFLVEIVTLDDRTSTEFQNCRRLCIHSNILGSISWMPYGPRTRSFLCFSKEEIIMPLENIVAIPEAFKLLRVLDVTPIKFTRFHSDFIQLVHLRYIAISFNLAILPSVISKLWNLETLIVDTTSRTLEVKADIWNMMRLRHVKMNAPAILPKAGKTSGGYVERLQTLGTISPYSCTEEVFRRARYLKKLRVRGRLAVLLDRKASSESASFDSLLKLGNLEKLKLLNDVFPDLPSEGKLHYLPPPHEFPPRLRSLTLSGTFLDWTHMSILGLLQNLEMLKLKDKAFMGKYWKAADGGFRNLQILHIGRTDLVSWKASAHHFPRLMRLELWNCEELGEVPIQLAEVSSFQTLDLYRATLAAVSAKRIRRMREENLGTKANVFKLSIFPPVE